MLSKDDAEKNLGTRMIPYFEREKPNGSNNFNKTTEIDMTTIKTFKNNVKYLMAAYMKIKIKCNYL